MSMIVKSISTAIPSPRVPGEKAECFFPFFFFFFFLNNLVQVELCSLATSISGVVMVTGEPESEL